MTDTAARAASLTLGDIAALIDKVEALTKRVDELERVKDGPILYTVKKAAEILGVNTRTILQWLADGAIHGERACKGGTWRIERSELVRFAAGNHKYRDRLT